MGGHEAGHGGGHAQFDTRSVWAPSGGWYADPRGWRRNTAAAFAAIFVISAAVASVSARLEARRPSPCLAARAGSSAVAVSAFV